MFVFKNSTSQRYSLNVRVANIIGENAGIIKRRASQLGIELLFIGLKIKVKVAGQSRRKLRIECTEVAFIGVDLGDLNLLRKFSFSDEPNNAPDYLKKKSLV
jgi:3-deoxy-D-manno-octulosonate 8-phosphate phosphatase (KDO 8-P phosphatase)